ncbi:MAG: hypothetical protein KDN19_21065 [Verrucomicrobiae bacterium]|nr:hypothetical protein [Verrucomicrobiae bacterium]
MSLPFFHRFVFLLLFLSLLSQIGLAESSRINRSAQALAKHLAPTSPAKKASDGDFAKARQRMIAAIEVVEVNYRSNGPRPESLIENALDFREGMGDWERLITMNAVLDTWREANGRGLFDNNGKFQTEITKGRGVGNRCVFERIVRGEVYPAASNQLANLRLVPEDQKRPDESGEPDHQERAYQAQLEKMMAEKEGLKSLAAIAKGPKTNSLGQTEEEARLAWEREVEEAGDISELVPNIRLDGSMTGTPSRMTKGRWRATAEITNLSTFPTEVSLDIYLIGFTDRKRDHYLMAKSTHSIKLRRNETRSIDAFTRSEGSYKTKADDHDEVPKKERNRTRVRARGFVMIVKQGDKMLTYAGSDKMMLGYADPENDDLSLRSLPEF